MIDVLWNIVRYISLIVLPLIGICLCAVAAYSIVKIIEIFKEDDWKIQFYMV